jgi:hypothetical protein
MQARAWIFLLVVSLGTFICYLTTSEYLFVIESLLRESLPENDDFLGNNAFNVSHPAQKNSPGTRRIITETFVISFDPDRVQMFKQRNHWTPNSAENRVLWQPAVDGFHQPTLDLWGKLVGKHPMNLAMFDRNNLTNKGQYGSPHAVGCYLAHWHLMRALQHRASELQPDLYFIFEDDASCIPNIINQTIASVQHLPQDWDIFLIGGKHFTFFSANFTGKNFYRDSTKDTLDRDICRGLFGNGTGPRAPDGSRRLSEQQPYWQTTYTSNTHAYVLNPHRIGRILRVLTPRFEAPIDIILAEAMARGEITAYTPTQDWCGIQGSPHEQRTGARTWGGFFFFPGPIKPEYRHPALMQDPRWVWRDKLIVKNCSF